MLLEVCAYNAESCRIAERAGAGRIEFCFSPEVGGTTPDFELTKQLIQEIKIPIYPIVRPRGGDFCYNTEEWAHIVDATAAFAAMGLKGISTGVALPDGRIDGARMHELRNQFPQLDITCHKVFDLVPNGFEALETLRQAGVNRVLTSGLHPTALKGVAMLYELVAASRQEIIIMPGGSVRSGNILEIARMTGASEFHSSGIVDKSTATADYNELKSIVDTLHSLKR